MFIPHNLVFLLLNFILNSIYFMSTVCICSCLENKNFCLQRNFVSYSILPFIQYNLIQIYSIYTLALVKH